MFGSEKIIAHRGASAYAPENTFAAFEKALAMGCHVVEFDVMCNEEGEPYVFHDEKLKRTSNGRGYFSKASNDYLDSLDAGKWFSKKFKGEKIPHFKEVIEWLAFSNMQANIEIKPCKGMTEQTTIATLSHINRYWPQDKPLPLLSSFEWEALSLTRNIAPEMPLGLLMEKWEPNGLNKAKQIEALSIHIERRGLKQDHVEIMKSNGYQVFVYTVNRKKQAEKLFSWGVDAIFSDYPDLLS
jgi:glycerophosphoryl diester phosphodiesterase